jgi:hypothetical protein
MGYIYKGIIDYYFKKMGHFENNVPNFVGCFKI